MLFGARARPGSRTSAGPALGPAADALNCGGGSSPAAGAGRKAPFLVSESSLCQEPLRRSPAPGRRRTGARDSEDWTGGTGRGFTTCKPVLYGK